MKKIKLYEDLPYEINCKLIPLSIYEHAPNDTYVKFVVSESDNMHCYDVSENVHLVVSKWLISNGANEKETVMLEYFY